MPKGKKTCPECGIEVAARSYDCKGCGYDFAPGKERVKAYVPTGAGRGKKKCPKCNTINGARAYNCASCGHDFKPGVKRPEPYVSKGGERGKKRCPKCSELCNVRSFRCPKDGCGHEFVSGKKPSTPAVKREEKPTVVSVNWKELEKGTMIRVLRESGDYHTNSETGARSYLTEPGKYTVREVDSEGLKVMGKSGFGFLYMGPEKPSAAVESITRSPCKISVVES